MTHDPHIVKAKKTQVEPRQASGTNQRMKAWRQDRNWAWGLTYRRAITKKVKSLAINHYWFLGRILLLAYHFNNRCVNCLSYGSLFYFCLVFCYAFVHVCLTMPCCLLLGKGRPFGSRLWCLIVNLSLSHWYPGSGVVLDCIDSWSLPFCLLLQPGMKTVAWYPCYIHVISMFEYILCIQHINNSFEFINTITIKYRLRYDLLLKTFLHQYYIQQSPLWCLW